MLCLKDRRRQPEVVNMALELAQEKFKQIEAKGLLPRPVRICVVGMPNTGKSSLINWLVGKRQVKVRRPPGSYPWSSMDKSSPKTRTSRHPGILPAIVQPKCWRKTRYLQSRPSWRFFSRRTSRPSHCRTQKRYPGMPERYLPEMPEATEAPLPPELLKNVEADDDDEENEPNWQIERDRTIFIQSKRNRKSGIDSDVDSDEEPETTEDPQGDVELDNDLTESRSEETAASKKIRKDAQFNEKINLQLIARAQTLHDDQGRPDTARAAAVLLGDLRNGKLGRVTFDTPEK